MAGIGSAWGSREEMLHPRDRHGRFRKKWKMAQGVVDALTGFLDRFQPRTFQSDQQASQYAFNHRARPWSSPELQRLHTDWDDANEALQAGEMDETTKRFVEMMDRNMVPTEDDLIVSQTVPPGAFGMTPQQAGLEDGGLEDFIGLEVADAGYSAMSLGSELSHPPGSITIRTALPKGTRVAYGGRSPNDRQLFLDRDQPLVITKVEPDGRGGWYMLAIAGSGKRTEGATAVADDRTFGRRGGGLTPEQREARVTPRMSAEERLRLAGNPPMAQRAAEQRGDVPAGSAPAPAPAPAAPAPAPSQAPAPAAPASPPAPTPAGVVERREPVHAESVGPGTSQGSSASDIAQQGEAARIEAENAPPAPAAPPSPQEFRDATADIPSPAAGKRRAQWNKAHQGMVIGKRDPQDVLRELDTDIQVAKVSQDRIKRGEDRPDPNLDSDVEAMDKLADTISEKYGVPRRGQTVAKATPAPAGVSGGEANAPSAPETPSAPAKRAPAKKAAGPKATPGAPSTSKEAAPAPRAPARKARRTPQEVADAIGRADSLEAADAELEGMTGAELTALADHMGAPHRARATKAQLRQAITHKRGRELDGDAIRDSSTRQRQEAGALTDGQKARIVDRAKQFRGKERNDDERRIVAMADEIEAGGEGDVAAKKFLDRQQAAENALATPGKKAPAKKAAAPEAPAAPAKVAKKVAAPAKKATPAKAAPSPVDAEEEAFKARVAEAGLPDRVTALRAMARDQKIRGFSTMNKRQLQSALLGDEVPKAGKIPQVTPAKMVPHLKAADSDQAAQKLLENHTLADLRALAKDPDVDVKLPSRGVTKDKAKDAIIRAIRGEAPGSGGETPARSLRQELDAQRWVEPSNPETADKVRGMISDTDEMDAADLRNTRDALEELSGQRRRAGDRQDANLIQTLADTMGMRAQTISGVEEPAVRAPVKKAVKKAVPEAPVERPLNKMLKPELEELADSEGVPNRRKSWTKAKLLEEIESNRRSKGRETDEDRLRRELEAVPTEAPAAPAPAKKATKKAAKKAVADVDRAAGNLSTQLRELQGPTGENFGDMLRRTDPEELRQAARAQGLEVEDGNTAEEIFDNTIRKALEDRMRELGMLPEDPKKPTKATKRVPKGSVPGPRAQEAVTTTSRRDSFNEAWDGQGLTAPGAAGRSLDEVRADIASGKLTPEEGVRRIETDIDFNKEDLAQLDAEMRGLGAPGDRSMRAEVAKQRRELRDGIAAQEKASQFIRDHFRDEAPVTREDLEVKLDPAEKAALDRVQEAGDEGLADLKRSAKDEGLGDIEGDNLDDVIQNIAKAVAARELSNREKEQRARDRQEEADRKRTTAEAIAGIEEVLDGSDRAVTARIKSQSKVSGLTNRDRDEMLGLVSDRDALRQALAQLGGGAGLRRRDERGDKTHFDPERHELPPGSDIKKGDPVTVLGTGFRSDVAGVDTQVHKARVTAGHSDLPSSAPEAPTAPKKAAKFLPPLKDGTQRKSFTNVEVGDVVQRAGARNGPAKRVTKVERGPGGIVLTFEDGTTAHGHNNTAAWMGRDVPEIPAPKVTKKAAQAAKALPSVAPKAADGDSKPHNAELIGAGLDIDRRGDDKLWMDAVQSELDRGIDGREIANNLRREADSQRTLHNIQDAVGGGTEGSSPAARVERMERMADRLEGVRPLAKAVPAKKARASKKTAPKTPEQDRADLTGTTGQMATAAIDAGLERLQAADTPEAEDAALKGILLQELKTMAKKLGLQTGGSKAVLIKRIQDRVKGREAPTTSAVRAVPTPSVPAVDESVPMQPYSRSDNMRMHMDSPTMGLVKAYEAAGRNGSANRMLDLRRRATVKGGDTTPQQVVDELKAIRAAETDPKFQRMLDDAIEANDSPMTSMPDLPPNLPPGAQDLMDRLHAIPFARKPQGSPAGIGTTSRPSLEDQVAEVLREIAEGRSRQQPEMRLRGILTQQVHELNEPSFRIWELADLLEPVTDAQGRRRPSPLVMALREMRPSSSS